MNALSILIIEDDPVYVLDLEVKLKKMANHKIYIVDSIAQATEIYDSKSIDLVLLDLKLKDEEDGFLFYKEINDLRTPVIIITAYSDQILFETASEYAPMAYLVKPFDMLTLKSLLQNVINANKNKKEVLFVKYKGQLIKLPIGEIYFLMSEGNYVFIHTKDKKFIIRKALSKVVAEVKSELLQQIHRSYVVNIDKIQSIQLTSNVLHIKDQILPLGRIYKKDLQNKLTIL